MLVTTLLVVLSLVMPNIPLSEMPGSTAPAVWVVYDMFCTTLDRLEPDDPVLLLLLPVGLVGSGFPPITRLQVAGVAGEISPAPFPPNVAGLRTFSGELTRFNPNWAFPE